jgi:hypothetical protein
MSQRARKRPPEGRGEESFADAAGTGRGRTVAGPQSALAGQSSEIGQSPDGGGTTTGTAAWPSWAVVLATCALLYHMLAVVSGALGVPPSSLLERRIADLFTPYHQLVDQGYAYRYYAEPPPTPVITARLRFGEGQTDRVVRIPDRALVGPRMRHQRQLALANSLFLDFQQTREPGAPERTSRLAAAYARKLCAEFPGCRTVTLHAQQHLIPDPHHVTERRGDPSARGFDLFEESLFTTPQWIGDFPCDGS